MIEVHLNKSNFRASLRRRCEQKRVGCRRGLQAQKISGNSDNIRFAVDHFGRSAISTVPSGAVG